MIISRKTLAAGISSLAAISLTVASLLATAPANSTETYSVPAAPTSVSATPVNGGVRVSWTASSSSPAATHYVVSGGQGSCPVTVKAGASSAVMPVLASNPTVTPFVQAVNAYGFSRPAAASAAVTATSFSKSAIKPVQILQFSDFHGAIEGTSSNMGAAIMSSSFATDRSYVPATVTVSAGDNIGAAPAISTQFDEIPTIEALNVMKLDVSTFGNHEHDQNIAHVQKIIGASNFSWVLSNYNTLAPLKSGKKSAKPFVIINRGGVKVGVVGMNTQETKDVVFPGNLTYTLGGKKAELVISDKINGVQAAVNAATRAGADVVVAVLHQGWNQNLNGKADGLLIEYAAKLKGVAAVYGGHTHLSYASFAGNNLTAQVRNSGVEYTRTQICVDTNANKVIGSSIDYVTAAQRAGFPGDSNAAVVVAKYKDQLSAKLDVKIGSVSALFPRGGSPAVERAGETPLGSYTADLLLNKYKTDLVLVNGGGIRDTLPAATYKPANTALKRPATGTTGPYDVVLGDAYTVFPFGNSISTTTITGANLWAALENGVSLWPSNGRFPHPGGFKFTFDTTKPAGSRVTAVTKTNGSAIAKDNTVYTVATVDFLIYGGDGYTQFDPAKARVRDLLVDVFAEGLKSDLAAGKTTLMPVADGRITVIK
jgi:5'-nucleotidase